jgi:hypothetical protein
MPSCIRCNNLLSDYIFRSIEEKRAYVRSKLNGSNAWDVVQALRAADREAEKRKIVLRLEVSMACVGGEPPENDTMVKQKLPAKVKPIPEYGQDVCKACFTTFTRKKVNQRFCGPEHKAVWEALMRKYGAAADGMFAHYRKMIEP